MGLMLADSTQASPIESFQTAAVRDKSLSRGLANHWAIRHPQDLGAATVTTALPD